MRRSALRQASPRLRSITGHSVQHRPAAPNQPLVWAGAAGAAIAGAAYLTHENELLRVERTKVCGALLTVTEARGKRWLSLGSVIQSIVFVDADGRAKLTQAVQT